MSLNGLDAPAIAEAAQALQTAASSAWFLLRYLTRDEIELYARGTNGIAEARAKIAEYEDKSPLYGLLSSDTVKVLVKYVPQGTSRLLQARVKVHFEELEERFPHDAQLSIVTAAELSSEALVSATGGAWTTSLSSPTPVAAATPATSATVAHPSASLPLVPETTPPDSVAKEDTIQEEEELASLPAPTSRAARLVADVRAGKLQSHEVLAALKSTPSYESEPDARTVSDLTPPKFPERKDSLNAAATDPAQPKTSISTVASDDIISQFPAPRLSSGSYNYDPYASIGYDSKVKRGPRPAVKSGPNSPGVASLPANISIPPRSAAIHAPLTAPIRPSSSQTADVPFRLGEGGMFPLVQAPASVIPSSYTESIRPKSRAGSVVTLPASYGASYAGSKGPKSPKDIPQEKLRLLKALELRRKQQQKERDASSTEPVPRIPSTATSPTMTNGASRSIPATSSEAMAAAGLGIELDRQRQQASSQSEVVGAQEAETNRGTSVVDSPRTFVEDGTNTAMSSPMIGTASSIPIITKAASVINVPPTVPEEVQQPTQTQASASRLPQRPETHEQVKMESAAGREAPVVLEPVPEMAGATNSAGGAVAAPTAPEISTIFNAQQPQPGLESVGNQAPVSTASEGQHVATVGLAEPQVGDRSANVTPTSANPEKSAFPEQVHPSSRYRPDVPHLHHKDVSISTSLSGASFLDELDDSNLEEAQPVTLLKSPVTPTAPKPFELGLARIDSVDVPPLPPVPAQTEKEALTTESQTRAPVTVESAPPVAQAAVESAQLPADKSEPTDLVASAERPTAVVLNESAVTSPAASDPRSTPLEEREVPFEDSPLSTAKGESPSTGKKHPTVNPPHIWGGPLRAASGASSSGLPPRHLSPAPDLQRMNRSASIASSNSTMLRPDSPSGFKKPGMGSRIADRIKALEKSSGGASGGSTTYITPGSVSVSSRKSSFNTPPGSSGGDTRKAPYPTPSPSPGSNIFTRRFGSIKAGPISESGRTDNTIRPTILNAGGHGAAGPNEIQRPTARPTYIRQQSSESRASAESSRKAGEKPSSSDGGLSPQKRGTFGSGRLSFSGKQNSGGHSRQSSVESTGTNSDKKDSKAKKLMKRMTGAFSPRKDRHGGNGGLSSEPILEGPEQESAAADTSYVSLAAKSVPSKGVTRPQNKWTTSVVIGEVNIQFPDTLLWKRRHMELDTEGYIVLLPSSTDRSSRVTPKKFHMSEFHPPYIPDQEREELPYSIILDFMDSSTLQCACQNSTDQTNVLAALSSVHSAFAQQSRR